MSDIATIARAGDLKSSLDFSDNYIPFSESAMTSLNNLNNLHQTICKISPASKSPFWQNIQRDVIHVSDNQLIPSLAFPDIRNIMPSKYKVNAIKYLIILLFLFNTPLFNPQTLLNIYCMVRQRKVGRKSQVFKVLTILPKSSQMPFCKFSKLVIVITFSRTSPVRKSALP